MTVQVINLSSKEYTKDMLVPPANLEHQGYRGIYWQAEKKCWEKVFCKHWDPQQDDSAYGKSSRLETRTILHKLLENRHNKWDTKINQELYFKGNKISTIKKPKGTHFKTLSAIDQIPQVSQLASTALSVTLNLEQLQSSKPGTVCLLATPGSS